MEYKNLKYKKVNMGDNYSEIIGIQCLDGNDNPTFIPINEGNIKYQEVLAWVAEGNTIEPADE